MAVDIIASIVVLWGLLRGWLRGFMYQIGQIGMLAVAFVAARALGDLVEPHVVALLSTADPRVHRLVAFFAVFLIIYVVGLLILRAFTRDVRRASETLSGMDRGLGMVVGGLKYAVGVYLLFVALIALHESTGKIPLPYGSSVVGRWVMKHNFLESEEFPRARALAKLGWLLHSDSARLLDDPDFRAVLEHPKAAVLRTPEVATALVRGDWVAVMGEDAVWDLLDEPEIQEHLNAIEWAAQSAGPQDATPPPGLLPEAPAVNPRAPAPAPLPRR